MLAIGASSPTNAWLLAQLSSEILSAGRGRALPAPCAAKAEGADSWAGSRSRRAGPAEEARTADRARARCRRAAAVHRRRHRRAADGHVPDPDRHQRRRLDRRRARRRVGLDDDVLQARRRGAGGQRAARAGACCRRAPTGRRPASTNCPKRCRAGPRAASRGPTPRRPRFGERVITGLPEGVSLRLEGEREFTRVLALGGGSSARTTSAAPTGAAFSDPREGWLGQRTAARPPDARTRAEPPRALAGALPPRAARDRARSPARRSARSPAKRSPSATSGEVARYKPGKGWLPESLLGTGGRVERRRACARSPGRRPKRAYAVGDHGADVAVARRNRAVGTRPGDAAQLPRQPARHRLRPEQPESRSATRSGRSGVLLRYGKTWTRNQEALPAAGRAGASFTSVAFAGSEAIVAYRMLPEHQSSNRYVGGLLVNNGSGWHVDEGSRRRARARTCPWAVAGLPDGGAAFTAVERRREGRPRVRARSARRAVAGDPDAAARRPRAGLAGAVPRRRRAARDRLGQRPNTFTLESEPSRRRRASRRT